MEKQKPQLETLVKYFERKAGEAKAYGQTTEYQRIEKIAELLKKVPITYIKEEELALQLSKKYCKESCCHPCHLQQKERNEQEYWNRHPPTD